MTITQRHEKHAVDVGYWHLYRFNPLLKAEGKNPFTLDSKEPTGDFKGFLMTEVRYTSLLKKHPQEMVDKILAKAEQDAKERYASYVRLATQTI